MIDDEKLISEYKQYHLEIWPEIRESILSAGVDDLEIYLLGNRLFMIMDTVEDFNHDKAMAELALKPRQSEWEAFMSRFQDSSSEATADQKWQQMERIYKMDE